MKDQKTLTQVNALPTRRKLFWDTHLLDHFNSPFQSMFNDLFDEFINDFMPTKIGTQLKSCYGSYPKCDIIDNESQYIIEMEIPGMDKDAITIQYDNNTEMLSIIGGKRTVNENDDVSSNKYIVRELRKSKFIRSFYIPLKQINQEFNAQFKDGILHINIPKKEQNIKQQSNIKKIQIK